MVQLIIPIDDLKKVIKESVLEVLESIQPNTQSVDDNLLTRQETAKYLHISLGTLDSYTKNGFIKAEKLGHRVLYRKSDINEALSKKVSLVKYKSK